MYNRNQNIISHILQTPVEPKSRNVLWDNGTLIKIWRKEGWVPLLGSNGEDLDLSKYLETTVAKTMFAPISIMDWYNNINEYLEYDATSSAIICKTNLIVQGDTSSEGSGSDNPGEGGITFSGISYKGKHYSDFTVDNYLNIDSLVEDLDLSQYVKNDDIQGLKNWYFNTGVNIVKDGWLTVSTSGKGLQNTDISSGGVAKFYFNKSDNRWHSNKSISADADLFIGSTLYANSLGNYGIGLSGSDVGGVITIHEKGTWKATAIRINTDGSIKVFKNLQAVEGINVTKTENASNEGTSDVAGVFIRSEGGIELSHSSTPYIDFHANQGTEDFSIRIAAAVFSNGVKQLNLHGATALMTQSDANIGSSEIRWNKLYCKKGDFSESLNVLKDATVGGNLVVTGDVSSGGTGQDTPSGGVTEEDVEQYLTNYVNDITTAGSGNVISSVSKSGKIITFTKGVTALTSHQSIYSLTIKNSEGTTQTTYTPNSAGKSLTLTKAMVGLGNVENTALSTWKGTSSITTLGTITSGTWNGSKIANAYLANSAMTIAGTSVSLGGSIETSTITAAQIGSGNSFYHSGNVNKTNVAWNASSLTMNGALTGATTGTFSSKLTANTLVLSNTEGKAHLTFSRGGINYIHANQSGGGVAFVVNGSGITLANAQLIISSDNYVYCGTEGLAQLGLGGKRWKSVYSIDGSFSGDLTAGTFSATSAVACGGRLRITADNNPNDFGFLKSTLESSNHYGLMHIGTNEGGTSIITTATYDKVAMSISRGVVGIGRQYSYNELKSYNDSNTRLYVDGNLVVTGDAASGSDIRFKDVIENKTIRIDDIAKAPLFSFKWNDRDDDSIHLGTSAQYWESIAPELVSGSDFKTLNYASLGVAMGISLAQEVKKLRAEMKQLKKEVYGIY